MNTPGAVQSPDGKEVLVVDTGVAGSELYYAVSDLANGRSPRTILHAMILGAGSAAEVAATLGKDVGETLEETQALAEAGVIALSPEEQQLPDAKGETNPLIAQYRIL